MIGERLGDRFRVEVYPSELLGSQTDMVQLTQTGAMDFCVASNAILETFSKDYELFNLPYLFQSTEAYHGAMEDEEVTGPVFSATRQAGFTAVAWLDAGTRNFSGRVGDAHGLRGRLYGPSVRRHRRGGK